MKRYQDCTRIVKASRWLRWKPYYVLKFLYWMRTAKCGRRLVWKEAMWDADVSMGSYTAMQSAVAYAMEYLGVDQ